MAEALTMNPATQTAPHQRGIMSVQKQSGHQAKAAKNIPVVPMVKTDEGIGLIEVLPHRQPFNVYFLY